MSEEKTEGEPGKQVSRNNVIIKAISSERPAIMESRALEEDEFQQYYSEGDVIEPLYNPELLTRLPEGSDILQQCIDAYKTNIAGFGVDLDYDVDFDKVDDEQKKKELERQWTVYENFFKFCSYDESFTKIMEKVIEDRERIGWGAVEVIPDASGKPAGFEHIPAHKVRLCRKERKVTPVQMRIIGDDGEPMEIPVMKRFRKFVQIINNHRVYFKEFGDPREMNCYTGAYEEPENPEHKATSIMFFNIYCPYTPYGLPRYIGQLLNIQGNRKAEELNYTYFRDGRHIPMAIIVENGKLTQESVDTITSAKGDASRHKYLILEAEGAENSAYIGDDSEKSRVNIRIEKLAEMLQKDGLFQEYCKNNRDKIRSAFRLHPIYTGESQDYNRATAETARQVTEEQVFQPDRNDIAFQFNNILKPQLDISEVSMKLAAPTISNPVEVATAISPYVEAGAATPNMLVDALGDLLGKSYEPFPEEWGDKPLQILLKEMEINTQKETQNDSVGLYNGQEDVKKADDGKSIMEILKELQISIEEALTA